MLRRCFVVAVLVLCSFWLAPEQAEARKQHELSYRFEQIWNAALRLVKVDLRMPITDRDPEGGYVLFDYVASGKRYPGSIELIAQNDGAHRKTMVVVQVQGMPSYVEQMILDRLEKKLLNEVGAPLEPPKPLKPQDPAPPRDAGADEAPRTD
ncbi:MAG: hypothetical protein JWN04_612 [Myxococcaceae bacterium]|nr:hypothetical protein [Myxococcaceae bacterium]